MTRAEQLAKKASEAIVGTPEENSLPYDWGEPFEKGFLAGYQAALEDSAKVAESEEWTGSTGLNEDETESDDYNIWARREYLSLIAEHVPKVAAWDLIEEHNKLAQAIRALATKSS